uniref:ABC transmembrane type-2 domain-containing protein n=1 Tax=Choreocolax polysiphoniae TaxID=282351 RepID=A0A0B5VQF8_9FLOR|nr:hypothetical protein [Choreocolax polysiphoniae]AJH65847.1 hypothetical protein [Choreocolax polysiphoniae]
MLKKINNLIPKNIIKLNINKSLIYQEIRILIKRLYLQTYRRPFSFIINIIQPLLWLLLFGALFQNAPISLFETYNIQYRDFLNPGIIIFTGFNSAINTGLPIIFDREFGFFNRILVSPLINKSSLIYSCIIHGWIITHIQILIIIVFNIYQTGKILTIRQFLINIFVNTLIIVNISGFSICNAFILPGHIEFIALTTLFINLPTLFTSTALAPLSFMPNWLQIISCINPLTYAIEIIRKSNLEKNFSINTLIMNIFWLNINVKNGIFLLFLLNLLSFVIIMNIVKYKYD